MHEFPLEPSSCFHSLAPCHIVKWVKIKGWSSVIRKWGAPYQSLSQSIKMFLLDIFWSAGEVMEKYLRDVRLELSPSRLTPHTQSVPWFKSFKYIALVGLFVDRQLFTTKADEVWIDKVIIAVSIYQILIDSVCVCFMCIGIFVFKIRFNV